MLPRMGAEAFERVEVTETEGAAVANRLTERGARADRSLRTDMVMILVSGEWGRVGERGRGICSQGDRAGADSTRR